MRVFVRRVGIAATTERGLTGVQTGCDNRLCAGVALVICGQTFGFGGHAATETGTIVPVCRPLAKCCCIDEVPNVSVRPWGLPLQAEFVKFGAKVHEGGDWDQPLEQVERVK